jgi:hypothetical protein
MIAVTAIILYAIALPLGVRMKDQDDKQTVDVFADVNTKRRGGSRPGAGRPKQPDTEVIRVPASMVDTIKLMIQATKTGHSVEYRIIPKA